MQPPARVSSSQFSLNVQPGGCFLASPASNLMRPSVRAWTHVHSGGLLVCPSLSTSASSSASNGRIKHHGVLYMSATSPGACLTEYMPVRRTHEAPNGRSRTDAAQSILRLFVRICICMCMQMPCACNFRACRPEDACATLACCWTCAYNVEPGQSNQYLRAVESQAVCIRTSWSDAVIACKSSTALRNNQGIAIWSTLHS